MENTKRAIDPEELFPRTVSVNLYASQNAKTCATFRHPYSGERPRIVVWRNQTYLQELSREDSPNYYAAESHWIW